MMAANSVILQINTNHCLEAVSLAVKNAQNFQAVVIAVTEPYRFRGKMMSAAPFDCIHTVNAALLVRRDVKFKKLPVQSPDIVAIEVGDVCLCSVYMSPNREVSQTCDTLEFILQGHRKVVVMGDLNCRLAGYTEGRMRPRDRRVQRMVNEFGLDVANSSTPTMDHNGVLGVNDYTLVKQCLVADWHVKVDTESLSDHRYIAFQLALDCGAGVEVRRTDFELLDTLLGANPPEEFAITTAVNCEEAALHLTRYLSEAVENSTTSRITKPCVHWWNEDLESMHLTLKRLRRQAHRNGSVGLRSLIKALRADFKYAIERAKKAAWRSFVTVNSPWGKPYKAIVIPRRSKQLVPSERLLASKIGGVPVGTLDEPQPTTLPEPHPSIRVTPGEVTAILKEVKNRSAPGTDGIGYKAVKLLNKRYPLVLPTLYSACLRLGVFPSAWKPGLVIWLPKPGKDPCEEGSYRPITLLSTLGKVLERCLARRILSHIQDHSVLSDRQFGFLPKRSTEDSVRSLLCDIQAHRRHFNFCAAIAIDIKGAFDNIDWGHLKRELARYQFPPFVRALVGSFLRNRVVQSGSACTQLDRGCPQGSVTGPLLWDVAYNFVLEYFTERQIMVNCYADDTVFVIAANTKLRLQKKINHLLAEVASVLARGGLSLSPEKTEVLVLCGGIIKNHTIPKPVPYHVLGKKRESVRKMKYLGMILDERLSWNSHIQYLLQKSWAMVPKIVAISANTFGYSNQSRRIMLQGTVGAYWRYCCSVFIHRLVAHRDSINRLHREMVRCCGRLYRTVSYYPATVIANFPPLELDLYRAAAVQCWKRGYRWNEEMSLQLRVETHSTLSSLVVEVEGLLLEEWQRRYDSCGHGAWTRDLLPVVGVEVPELDFYLAQALSGHGTFREYLFRFKRAGSPLCECGEVETPDHVFRHCVRHAAGRPRVLNPREESTLVYLQGTVRKLWNAEREREHAPVSL